MMRFEEMGDLGEGTYGVVKKCRHKASGLIVAVKKFKDCKDAKQKQMINKTAAREVQVLEAIQHVNLVRLLDSFRVGRRLHLVFEYVEGTVLQALEAKPQGLGDLETRKIMWQIVRATEYLHSRDIVHRDLKPENLLLSRDGMLKLCDFGFARYMSMEHLARDMSGYVATRWYRAPELLLADNDYGPKVDIWAIGCLLVEIQTGEPLFAGESDVDQLWIIMKSFTDGQTASLRGKLLFQRMKMPGPQERQPLHSRFQHLGQDALSFLEACLHPHPDFRLSCKQLLEMPYFHGAETWFRPSFFAGEGAKAARMSAVCADKEVAGQRDISRAQSRPRRQKRRNENSPHVPAALNISPYREQRGNVPQEIMQSMATLDPAQRCAELRHGYAACSPDGDLQASVMMSKFNISQDAQNGKHRGAQIELSVRAGPQPLGYPAGQSGTHSSNAGQGKHWQEVDSGSQVLRYQTPNRHPHKRLQGKQSRTGDEFQSPDPRWRRKGREDSEFQSPDPRWRRQGHRSDVSNENAHRTPSRLVGNCGLQSYQKQPAKVHSTELTMMHDGPQAGQNFSPSRQANRNTIPAFYGKQAGQQSYASPDRWASREANRNQDAKAWGGWNQKDPSGTPNGHALISGQQNPNGRMPGLDLSQQGHRMTMTGQNGLAHHDSPSRWDSPSRNHANAPMKKSPLMESPLRAQAPVFVPLAMQMQGKQAAMH